MILSHGLSCTCYFQDRRSGSLPLFPRCFVDCTFNLTKFAKPTSIYLSSDANSRVFVVGNVDTNGMVDKESMRL